MAAQKVDLAEYVCVEHLSRSWIKHTAARDLQSDVLRIYPATVQNSQKEWSSLLQSMRALV